ncbi:MAG: hypothetical protein US96_C0025G0001, partial [Candidatus Woesebacteria bacterium GW2011_GWB1_38_5b]
QKLQINQDGSYIRKNSYFVVLTDYNSKQKINQGIDKREYKN